MTNIEAFSAKADSTIRDAMAIINASGMQMLLLLDDAGRLLRTVTDGDLRRLLLAGAEMGDTLESLPPLTSVTAPEEISRKAALQLMDQHEINHLPLIDGTGRVVRVLDRRDIGAPILLSTPHMGEAELHYIEEAFRTNWIAPLGPNVDAFEREIADLVGAGHAAAVSSGTAAIHLAVRILGVRPGDKVFCSTLTFAASANPIVYEGGEPVFIDSEPGSWNMSPQALERAFDAATAEGWLPKAVIVVNLYGQSADMDALTAICDRHGVPVIEDAAESLGARYKGKPSGVFGRMGVYSFNGNKIITTSGGGMLVSDNEDLIKQARFLATQARDPAPHYQHSQIGFNYRMSNILAGVGRGQLQVLEQRVEARRAVYQAYRDGLADIEGLEWQPEPDWSYSNRWLSALTVDPTITGFTASELIARLADEMIEARPVWKPMHLQPVFAHCRHFAHGNEPVADRIFDQGICMPSGSNMSLGEIARVVEAMRAALRAR
ncbi:aminotransferase class I/II-fold pyridoxal phosphate-dependent enzyme [Brevundimonas sp.]|uniref:aminotransferase class I/II-fold pyridoxal phosphate-dependent enzyme n=1 Tax=Brevundimonas sp. TaxID=1871086 RepID=UPI002D65922F|nr:aminotransferase class I/II-fold pyridoxal phosphate-dependent enzyme [Brevundimonas sp.]HYC73586.1 aminotransferase class I/II-fold pyridoxal phosphate-dependent enzyme [Brevundimonas sp.]